MTKTSVMIGQMYQRDKELRQKFAINRFIPNVITSIKFVIITLSIACPYDLGSINSNHPCHVYFYFRILL